MMKEYPSIEEFLIGDPTVFLSPEEEEKINKYMEELHQKHQMEIGKAIIEARNTFIW